MKTSRIAAIIVVVALVGIFSFKWSQKNNPPLEQTSSIKGCYIVTIEKDVYTLTILSQDRETFSGKLSFKNFQKDSSSGTYNGTYKDGILLGDYSFASEGMNSVMQVIFKKSGDDFIRGYGPVNQEGNRFADLDNITYNPSPLSLFKKGECPQSATWKDDELGIQFSYAMVPSGYVLEERAPINAKNNLEKVLTLFRAEDKLKEIPIGGEWPPVISISIFTNLQKEQPRSWADKNTEYSNINLKMGEVIEISVGGKKAIRYTADGLYASENVVALHEDKIYVITGQFIDQGSDIRRDFESVLSSIRFID